MVSDKRILSLENIEKRFDGVIALKSASIEVTKGEVHALVGENGAGKSTLIKTITGALAPEGGTIKFEGVAYKSLSPKLANKLGISAIYQEFTLAPDMSVAENIYLGQKIEGKIIFDKRIIEKKASLILKRLSDKIKPSKLVSELTVAYKQLVEIAKAIEKNTKFLIMDEPTAPLTDEEVAMLMKIIADLKKDGITILYISHRLDEIFEIADRVTVMRDGEVITTKKIKELSKKELISLMVGRELSEQSMVRRANLGEEWLRVDALSGKGIGPISFSVRRGEIVGLGGLVGAGRTELVRLIFGADTVKSGEIFIKNQRVKISSPKEAVSHKIGFVPEDRKHHGALLEMPLLENVSIVILKALSKLFIINKKNEIKNVGKQVESLHIKISNVKQLVKNLSGGNQQKVVLGKWLASDCELLILDEPTRGIDVGAKQEIYRIIYELAEKGKAIIVISSEMEEIINLTDRMMILFEGNYMGELEKHAYTQEKILHMASGEI